MNDFINIISSVGFPIACCAWMAYYGRRTLERLADVISKNTAAVEKISLLVSLVMDDTEEEEL